MTAVGELGVLVVGVGGMGRSHARAYNRLDGFRLVGLCGRTLEADGAVAAEFPGIPIYQDFHTALAESRPDVVSINTYADTHAAFAIAAMEAGAHVFVEKPLARTVEEAESVVACAHRLGRKLVIGYILRVHPSWKLFIEKAQLLGKPLVMRMNLNQQAAGASWTGMQNLMQSLSPLVDCGVHYVDMMCLATGARPVRVHAIGARLSDEIASDVYNYGQLQVVFDDGSVGWYEAGWGPMMSEVAYFVKDIVGPRGAVSIVMGEGAVYSPGQSADVESHTRTDVIRLHHAALDENNRPVRTDEVFHTGDEPDHDELCMREQAVLLDAIRHGRDLGEHMNDAVNSLRIVLAADRSIRTGKLVELDQR